MNPPHLNPQAPPQGWRSPSPYTTQPQPPQHPQPPPNPSQLDGPMSQLYVGEPPQQAPSPVGQDAGFAPPRSRRANRVYHQDDASASQQPDYSQFQQQHQQYHQQPPPPQDNPNFQQNNGYPPHGQPHFQDGARPPHQGGAPLPAPAAYVAAPPPDGDITQPPHAAGRQLPGLRTRIDPDQIPSPVAVQQMDHDVFKSEPYQTCSQGAVPLSNTEFVALDQGNCSPRFIRMSTYSIPATDEIALAAAAPLGLIVQPFATLRPQEEPVPVVDFGDAGPTRCNKCRGYINPWSRFIDGGRSFICNLCGGSTDVPPEYFSHLDVQGRRMDLGTRPELLRGSVEFRVPKEYWMQNPNSSTGRPPEALNIVFAIDVSWTSCRSGILPEVTRGIKETLSLLAEGTKVAIITFDRTVQFYNLKADQASMLVVPDLEDMFLPLSEGFLVDPAEYSATIESLLDSLPSLFAENQVVEAAVGGPLNACAMALKELGGQVNIFLSSLPSVGPGGLKHREDSMLYNTEKEKNLFAPQDPFYRTTAEECVESGIGVNMFLFPSQYIDVATLGIVASMTGGDIFFHPRFDPVREGLKLRSEIRRVLTRDTGTGVTMRIRCSNGLRVSDYFGNFFQRTSTDLELGVLDADKAFAALLKHDSKLDDKTDAHIQCAVLFTNTAGERRVRVHNLCVQVTSLLANVFRYADMDATMVCIAKQAMATALTKPLRTVRENLTDTCVKILLAYRRNCASSTSPAQLILPESFKLLPIYTLALIKTKALKGGPVASDVRTHQMRLIKSASAGATMALLYPRMLPIHTFTEDIGMADGTGIRLPPSIRPSYTRMASNGAYLLENGDLAILWLGANVSPQILRDLWGVEDLGELDVRMTSLPNLPTQLSQQLRAVTRHIEEQRGRSLAIHLARQNMDGSEVEFSNMLTEDQNNDALGYPDYLCLAHKHIQTALEAKSSVGGETTPGWGGGAW